MKIIIGNWKMNGTNEFAVKFINEINKIETKNCVVICPPTGLIPIFKDFRYQVGAQNCFYKNNGAFTGETSPALLKDLGCSYVLIGHSERRNIFGEKDELLYKKWESAIANNLKPVVCIGERAEEKSRWKEVLKKQLDLYLGKDISTTIFAYEPVWSIGTGIIPSVDEIFEVYTFIKSVINNPQILYGGSVNSKNYQQILQYTDGLLIGGASLKIEEFSVIMNG